MQLREFLEKRGIRQADFAARIGIGQAHVSRLVAGDRIPSVPLALKIQEKTDGDVPLSAWIRPKRKGGKNGR